MHPGRRRNHDHVRRDPAFRKRDAHSPQCLLELGLRLVGHQHERRSIRVFNQGAILRKAVDAAGLHVVPVIGSSVWPAARASNITGWPAQWFIHTYWTFSARSVASSGPLSVGSRFQYGDWKASTGAIDATAARLTARGTRPSSRAILRRARQTADTAAARTTASPYQIGGA